MIGRLLGNRYEIIEQIGGGGMSLVYHAKDIYLNRSVAVKVLREQFTSDEEFVARFRREAQAVASLSHGNIVSIYDVGRDNDTHYLVMELVQGRDLKEVIREKGPLPIRDAVEIAKQICDALEHAHENQIIHRDIKPHNIIMTEQGKIKVTDFGIARAITNATVTHTGSIMGSVHYFSPEQAKGEIADEKSDIYSLGVVIYEMVTGTLPFEGDSPISVALKKIQSDPVAPRKINPEIKESLEQVILKALAKEPKYRYSSVRELREDLLKSLELKRLPHDVAKKVTEDTITIPKVTPGSEKGELFGKPYRVWIWILGVLMALGFIIGMYLSATVMARGEVTVPSVVELTVPEATEILQKHNLTLDIARTVNHATVEKGHIISQNPKAQEVIKKNQRVEVVVSDGPTMVTVPNVINSNYLEAEVTLTNHGLVRGEITRAYNSEIAPGNVINQEPSHGKEVVQGTIVNLTISRGPEPVWIKMPDLTGQTLTQASYNITKERLNLGVVQPEPSYKYPKDVVIRQDPGPESDILVGSLVNLVVSAGPGPIGDQATVKVKLHDEGTIKIVVDDERGRSVAYQNDHDKGELIERAVSYYGRGYIEVYVDEKLVNRRHVG